MAINSDKVYSSLEKLVHPRLKRAISPLIGLLVVDDYLDDPDWPCTHQIREFALHDILIGLIRENFTNHRDIFSLDAIPDSLSYQEVVCSITEDAKIGSPQLLGWGWLYYRYVLADLNLTQQKFAELCCITERTLRRYQYHTIDQLTVKLMQKERAALQNRRLGKSCSN